MNVADLDSFVQATHRAFEKLVHVTPTSVEVSTERGLVARHDVSAIIGLSGEEDGTVVISFPEDVARRAVGRILGQDEMKEVDQDVADGVGELVNVVAGSAKRGLAARGLGRFSFSLPTVILGAKHRVLHAGDIECLVACFATEIGPFSLQVCLRPARPGSREVPACES